MKKCFGNYFVENMCEDHSCTEKGCFARTMISRGACACPYKENCTLLTQRRQTNYRKENNRKISDCGYYEEYSNKRC